MGWLFRYYLRFAHSFGFAMVGMYFAVLYCTYGIIRYNANVAVNTVDVPYSVQRTSSAFVFCAAPRTTPSTTTAVEPPPGRVSGSIK